MALDFMLSEEQKLVRNSVRSMLQPFLARRQEFREMAREGQFSEEL